MVGEAYELEAEINHLIEIADQSNSVYANDPYFIGLLTSILYNVERPVDGEKYGKRL